MESGKAEEGVWSRLLTAASVKEKAETCNLFVIGDNSDALSRRIVSATGSENGAKESASGQVDVLRNNQAANVFYLRPAWERAVCVVVHE